MSRTVTKSVENIYHKSDEVHEIVDDKLFLNTRNNEQYKLMTFGKILVNGTVDQAVVTQWSVVGKSRLMMGNGYLALHIVQ